MIHSQSLICIRSLPLTAKTTPGQIPSWRHKKPQVSLAELIRISANLSSTPLAIAKWGQTDKAYDKESWGPRSLAWLGTLLLPDCRGIVYVNDRKIRSRKHKPVVSHSVGQRHCISLVVTSQLGEKPHAHSISLQTSFSPETGSGQQEHSLPCPPLCFMDAPTAHQPVPTPDLQNNCYNCACDFMSNFPLPSSPACTFIACPAPTAASSPSCSGAGAVQAEVMVRFDLQA